MRVHCSPNATTCHRSTLLIQLGSRTFNMASPANPGQELTDWTPHLFMYLLLVTEQIHLHVVTGSQTPWLGLTSHRLKRPHWNTLVQKLHYACIMHAFKRTTVPVLWYLLGSPSPWPTSIHWMPLISKLVTYAYKYWVMHSITASCAPYYPRYWSLILKQATCNQQHRFLLSYLLFLFASG